ncbi:NUDIX domain-containing protein [bacterium]|nr:NUDIX domain-containing protein [bacterium]
MLFQIRKDTGTFYTTASGHVLAGETIKQAFSREVKEELGIDVDVSNAELV